MGQVDDHLAHLLLGQLTALQGGIELEVEQVVLPERGQHPHDEEAAVPDVQGIAGPDRPEEVVDRQRRVVIEWGVRVEGEAVDLRHLGQACGRGSSEAVTGDPRAFVIVSSSCRAPGRHRRHRSERAGRSDGGAGKPRLYTICQTVGSRSVRGILSAAGYVPYRRLSPGGDRRFHAERRGHGHPVGGVPRRGHHHLGVEAARLALRACPDRGRDALWFATSTPAYLDKTNATVVHAALRLPSDVPAFDFGGALRSGAGALRPALADAGAVLVVASDTRNGLPTSADESAGGDAGAAVAGRRGRTGGAVIAEWLGRARPPTSSSIDGGARATGARSCGRSGSARPATWPSGRRPGNGR